MEVKRISKNVENLKVDIINIIEKALRRMDRHVKILEDHYESI